MDVSLFLEQLLLFAGVLCLYEYLCKLADIPDFKYACV